jgi:hypothetical protein
VNLEVGQQGYYAFGMANSVTPSLGALPVVVVALLDQDKVVCQYKHMGESCQVMSRDKIFETEQEAKARAVELLREDIARIANRTEAKIEEFLNQ